MKRITIIGAGYCGAAAAALLLHSEGGVPLEVVLLNRSGLLGRGMAYGTSSVEHLLNVPVGRMDALPNAEKSFLRYAQMRDPNVEAGSFVSRKWFGDYLDSILQQAAANPQKRHRFKTVIGDAVAIHPSKDECSAKVVLHSGEVLEADRIILALGNFAPADPVIPIEQRSFFQSRRYVRDPWHPAALESVKPDMPVLLIGSGLTMLDVVLSLRAHGLRARIHALSRRGLAPLAHRELETAPVVDQALPQRLLAKPAIRHWLSQLRTEAAAAVIEGHDWRDVIGSLRAATPDLWRALPPRERARFLRHLRPYWDVHRHRHAPALGDRLQAELHAKSLRLIAGRVLGFVESNDSVQVVLRRRGRLQQEALDVDVVINCTGPESNTRTAVDPFIAGLREQGTIKPDALGLGLELAADYRVLNRSGRASSVLFYVGPFLRADHWEATAVPELRMHTARMIAAVLESLRNPSSDSGLHVP